MTIAVIKNSSLDFIKKSKAKVEDLNDNDIFLKSAFYKFDKQTMVEEDGNYYAWAYISSASIDSDGEIIEPEAIEKAWPTYKGNIRVMHREEVGGAVVESEYDLDKKQRWIKMSLFKEVWEGIKKGFYQGVSIGGQVTDKIGNKITGLNLFEISVVDVPANPDALIVAYKRNKNQDIKSQEEKNMFEELEKSGYTIQDLINLLKSSKENKDINKSEDKSEEDKKKEEEKTEQDKKEEDKKEEDKNIDSTTNSDPEKTSTENKEENKETDKPVEDKPVEEDKKEEDKTEKSYKLEDALAGLNVIFKNSEIKDEAKVKILKSISNLSNDICNSADKEELVFSGEEKEFDNVTKSLEVVKSFTKGFVAENNEELIKENTALKAEIEELKKSAVFEKKLDSKIVKKSLKTSSSLNESNEEENLEELEKSITVARENFEKSSTDANQEKLVYLLMKRNMMKH